MFLSALFSGCGSKKEVLDPYFFLNPRLPITAPLKLHQAGEKVSLDFWVVPEPDSQRVRGFFIGFRVSLPASGQPNADSELKKTDFLDRSNPQMPVRITLVKIGTVNETKIPLLEDYFVAGMEKSIDRFISNDTAIRPRATSADGDLMRAKNLEDPEKRYREFHYAMVNSIEAGHYRLELEVLKSNVDAAKISAELLISNYRKGK
jgi:hypothetical protein